MRMESLISIMLGCCGIILFSYLLIQKHMTQTSYVILLTVLSLTCLALHGFSRIRELDLKNMKIILDRMETIKAEVYAKTEDLNKTSLELSRLIAVNTAFQGIIGSKEMYAFRSKLTRNKIETLLRTTDTPESAITQLFKYQDAINQMQATEDKEERQRLFEEFEAMINRDANAIDLNDTSNKSLQRDSLKAAPEPQR